MSEQYAIQVDNLGKRYKIGSQRSGDETLIQTVTGVFTAPVRRMYKMLSGKIDSAYELEADFWALRNISFNVTQGEVVGIIGRNGAGKSTLLKLLSSITEPSEGRITLTGRVGSLLEVGTGFHPDLTGRENVYLNGTILGMTRQEVKRKFDDIVAFAGVEHFIDTPVKHYSSGMQVRLGFAVAAHLEPEILIIDEVLSVGDAQFQKKSIGKMGEVSRSGRTVLIVSHQLNTIQGLADRVIVLDDGNIKFDGNVEEGIQTYLSMSEIDLEGRSIAEREDRTGSGKMRFTNVIFKDDTTDTPIISVYSGQRVRVEIEVENTTGAPLDDVAIHMGFYEQTEKHLFTLNTEAVGQSFSLPKKGAKFIAVIPKWPLTKGTFHYNLYGTQQGSLSDWVRKAGLVETVNGDFFGTGRMPNVHSGFLLDHAWHIKIPEVT